MQHGYCTANTAHVISTNKGQGLRSSSYLTARQKPMQLAICYAVMDRKLQQYYITYKFHFLVLKKYFLVDMHRSL